MAEVQDVVHVEESLLAKKDVIVQDADGVSRKIHAGVKVPLELREAYEEETGKELGREDTGTLQKSDDFGVPGDDEVEEHPGDETLKDSQGGPAGSGARTRAAEAEKKTAKKK